VQLLREKINEREQQLLVLGTIRQQLEERERKIRENGDRINEL
jgi:hypothetical protein